MCGITPSPYSEGNAFHASFSRRRRGYVAPGRRWRPGIDAREVRRLVAEDDEGQYLEFKPAEERPGSLATSLAAFANADGGTLILGVAERTDNGRKVHVIEGVPDVKIATDHLYSAAELCTPKLPLPAPERIDVVSSQKAGARKTGSARRSSRW